MSTYKITNITHLAGKRDLKYNSVLDIEYVDQMVKKTVKIKPNDSLYLTISTLPLSVHRLRVKNLITVTEVSNKEMEQLKPKATTLENKEDKKKKKPATQKKVVEEVEEEDSVKKTAKKKYTKKETEESEQ
jgi:hypothetical protein